MFKIKNTFTPLDELQKTAIKQTAITVGIITSIICVVMISFIFPAVMSWVWFFAIILSLVYITYRAKLADLKRKKTFELNQLEVQKYEERLRKRRENAQ